MSEENQAPEGEQNALSSQEDARANDLSDAQAPTEERSPEHEKLDEYYQAQDDAKADGQTVLIIGSEASLIQLQARLAELTAHRDRAREPELVAGEPNPEFIEYRDCDRILGPGTIVKIDGVPCRLLTDAAVMSETFRDEAVFVEHLAASGQGLAANARGLRNVYDPRGKVIGVNERHGFNRLCAEIARLEAQIAELEAAEAAEAAKAGEAEKAE